MFHLDAGADTQVRVPEPEAEQVEVRDAVLPNEGAGPLELQMHQKLLSYFNSEGLGVVHLELKNDSPRHEHHAAMKSLRHEGILANAARGGQAETHFHLTIVSDGFEGVSKVECHRMVNRLFTEEFDQGPLHALGINTMTRKQWEKAKKKRL